MKVPEFFRGIFPDTSHVSPRNLLVRSIIYGIDDRVGRVSSDNRLVRANLVDFEPSAVHPQDVIERFRGMMELVRHFPTNPPSPKLPPARWQRGDQ